MGMEQEARPPLLPSLARACPGMHVHATAWTHAFVCDMMRAPLWGCTPLPLCATHTCNRARVHVQWSLRGCGPLCCTRGSSLCRCLQAGFCRLGRRAARQSHVIDSCHPPD